MLASLREAQCTLLLSGPTHAVWVSEGQSRHIHDPALSGKGLGSSQSMTSYLSQVELRPQDLLVLCGKFPPEWEADLLNERPPASLDASYRKLTFTKGDLNAVLIQAHSGPGILTVLRPDPRSSRAASNQPQAVPVSSESSIPENGSSANEVHEESPISKSPVSSSLVSPIPISEPDPQAEDTPQITEEELDSLVDFAAHMVQPSAYAIPPQPESAAPQPQEQSPATSGSRGFPASIPRARPAEQKVEAEPEKEQEESEAEDLPPAKESRPRRRRREGPSPSAVATRQVAKAMVGGFKIGRSVNERMRTFMQGFVPRLLPGVDSTQPLAIPTYVMVFIAIVIPVLVVTAASLIYFRYGQSIQYDELYAQANNIRTQALGEPDPALQRDEWQSVLNYINKADDYRDTKELDTLRNEAQTRLDGLMGVIRLEFVPAFTNGLGNKQISRMAASESDLYMLDAKEGNILHATFTGRSLALDNTFDCKPGPYGGYQVGSIVDMLALPKVNALNAAVLGIDINGNLLYCTPGQVPQVIPLPALPNTNWGRITAFALDNDSLYVLDAESRAVWVFVGKDGSFLDTPYFYFGNQIPNTENAIDLAVSGDDLYMLYADGHLVACTFSRISATPTRCQDPAPRIDNYPAHRDLDIFRLAHFTQMSITNPPNTVLLLLDADGQSVFRFSPRSFELQNQLSGYAGKNNPFQRGSVSAMAVSPNYVLYLAIGNQVYFATNLP